MDFDDLDDRSLEGLADLLQWKFAFSEVIAVPSDETPPRTPAGPRLARILQARRLDEGYPTLIVDDVLTRGTSMEDCRRAYLAENPGKKVIGFVILARCPKEDGGSIAVPSWVWAMMSVNQWSQSRATGLG
jgi:hypoxanthine phosphoribosyltransferase